MVSTGLAIFPLVRARAAVTSSVPPVSNAPKGTTAPNAICNAQVAHQGPAVDRREETVVMEPRVMEPARVSTDTLEQPAMQFVLVVLPMCATETEYVTTTDVRVTITTPVATGRPPLAAHALPATVDHNALVCALEVRMVSFAVATARVVPVVVPAMPIIVALHVKTTVMYAICAQRNGVQIVATRAQRTKVRSATDGVPAAVVSTVQATAFAARGTQDPYASRYVLEVPITHAAVKEHASVQRNAHATRVTSGRHVKFDVQVPQRPSVQATVVAIKTARVHVTLDIALPTAPCCALAVRTTSATVEEPAVTRPSASAL